MAKSAWDNKFFSPDPFLADEELTATALSTGEDIAAIIAQREEATLRQGFVRLAIGKLPDQERIVVESLYFDGLREKSTARLLEISPAAVQQLHESALGHIQSSVLALLNQEQGRTGNFSLNLA